MIHLMEILTIPNNRTEPFNVYGHILLVSGEIYLAGYGMIKIEYCHDMMNGETARVYNLNSLSISETQILYYLNL